MSVCVRIFNQSTFIIQCKIYHRMYIIERWQWCNINIIVYIIYDLHIANENNLFLLYAYIYLIYIDADEVRSLISYLQ